MEKGICYSTSGLIEYVPFGDEKYLELSKCFGSENSFLGEVLVNRIPGVGFVLKYTFAPRKVLLEEESTNGE